MIDAAIGGNADSDRRFGAKPGGNTELELLLSLIEERDRAGGRIKDQPGRFDDSLQKLLVAAGAEHRAEVGCELCQVSEHILRGTAIIHGVLALYISSAPWERAFSRGPTRRHIR